MRILHLIQHFKAGGIEKHVIELSLEQIADGDEVTVLAMFGAGELREEFQRENINTTVLGCRSGHDLKLYARLRDALNLGQYDTIHIHVASFLTPFVFLLNKFDCRVVYSDHITKVEKKPKLKNKLNNFLLSLSVDRYIAVSNNTKQGLIKHFNVKKEKIDVVYNGVLSSTINQKVVLSPSMLHVGLVCRLEKDKGCLEYLNISKNFVNKDIVFHLFGTGSLLNEIKTLVSKFELEHKFIIHGFVNNPRDYIRELDILFILSEAEAFPLTIIEAFAEKTPVIGFNPIGGVTEMTDGIYKLHEKRDIKPLIRDLSSYIDNPEYRDRLEKATELAYRKYQVNYNSKVMCSNIKNTYLRIAK